ASGDSLWTRTYGGTEVDEGFSVQQTADGGYIVAGATWSFGAGGFDVYLIKTGAQGDSLWTRTYGGTREDVGKEVRQTTDGGYIIAGRTYSFGGADEDVYLIKTDSLGNVGVVDESPSQKNRGRKLPATVVRSLPQDATAFNALGTRVLSPKPGIYFVKDPQAQAKAQAVRKVLLVR
ncbi:hypothetical protein JXD38_10325, partial [candidate division WOR-3 bacterium]|nr:hypothetical protein [candidate division WOR-3 bacterium]